MLQSQLLFSLDLAAGSCLGVKYACILAPHIALETTREVQTIPKKNVKDKVKIAAREETSPYWPQGTVRTARGWVRKRD